MCCCAAVAMVGCGDTLTYTYMALPVSLKDSISPRDMILATRHKSLCTPGPPLVIKSHMLVSFMM